MVLTLSPPNGNDYAVEIGARLSAARALRPNGSTVAHLLTVIGFYEAITDTGQALDVVQATTLAVIRDRLSLRLVSDGVPEHLAYDLAHNIRVLPS